MEYMDQETNEKFIPYIIESTIGVDRVALAILSDAYNEEKVNDDTRIVLKLNPIIAPYKVAVLPLTKKQSDSAKELYKELSYDFMCSYDEAGTIGKRYRRQDEIGTPYCITIDYDTVEDNCVTIRNRDTMEQERINMKDVKEFIKKELENYKI